jgi:hypothetical protein
MVLLLVLGPKLLPEFRDPDAGGLDLISVALALVAVLAAIFGLKRVAQDGVGWLPLLSIVGALAVGLAFVRRQRALTDPLIDLRLFRVPAFSASLAANRLERVRGVRSCDPTWGVVSPWRSSRPYFPPQPRRRRRANHQRRWMGRGSRPTRSARPLPRRSPSSTSRSATPAAED